MMADHTAYIQAEIQRILDGEVFHPVNSLLGWFFEMSARRNLSCGIQYHNGLFQKPEGEDEEEGKIIWSEPFLDETQQGYTVTVGQRIYTKGHDGDQVYWPTKEEAVYAALVLLRDVLREKHDEVSTLP